MDHPFHLDPSFIRYPKQSGFGIELGAMRRFLELQMQGINNSYNNFTLLHKLYLTPSQGDDCLEMCSIKVIHLLASSSESAATIIGIPSVDPILKACAFPQSDDSFSRLWFIRIMAPTGWVSWNKN